MHHVLPYRAQDLRHMRKCVVMSSRPAVTMATGISSLRWIPSGSDRQLTISGHLTPLETSPLLARSNDRLRLGIVRAPRYKNMANPLPSAYSKRQPQGRRTLPTRACIPCRWTWSLEIVGSKSDGNFLVSACQYHPPPCMSARDLKPPLRTGGS